jgi:hypothetical protein
MLKQKAIFLTHPKLLKSEVTGGVQLCSQEFHYILSSIDDLIMENYFVEFTKDIFQRIQMKLGFENYSMYDVKRDTPGLINYIKEEGISIVFINMASLVRYARPIREAFGDKVKIILLSHGNHSGDFLHLITKPLRKKVFLQRIFQKIRLGFLIATESLYRVRYLDGVIALSETEKQIENWFGGKRVAFLPRRIFANFVEYNPDLGRVGFVGRLDHPPNIQGITILLEEMIKHTDKNVKLRLVGAPVDDGNKIAVKYKCVEYLGELSDEDLDSEITTWSFLINPVWWYSTGASTKLSKAISWGIPIATTTAGIRGYQWKKGNLLVADSPGEMITKIYEQMESEDKVRYWSQQTRIIAENGLTIEDLTGIMRSVYA